MSMFNIIFKRTYALKSAGATYTKTVKPAFPKSAPVYSKYASKATPTADTTTPDTQESTKANLDSAKQNWKYVSTKPAKSSIAESYPKGKTLENSLKGTTLADMQQWEASYSDNIPFNIDWSTSFFGLGAKPFSDQVQQRLAQALTPLDIEIKPDGLIYLPEIKYRRALNNAFGAGGWGLVPRSETIITDRLVTREYGLVCHGQLVGVARGEQDYFSPEGIPTATEGCKSNSLMRCCKDLGIGSELWDPVFIKTFKKQYCEEKFVEHVVNKKKKKIWIRKDRDIEYPWK
ncbi:hypothetical protein ACO0RG_002155 [Hanseniaspora osmophila]